MTSGMVSSRSLPDSPSRPGAQDRGAWGVGWSSVADTNICLISLGSGTAGRAAQPIWSVRTVIPRMRLGHRPVKLPIANVLMFRWLPHAALSPLKTPRKQIYSPQLRRFKERRLRQPLTLTKTGRSRLSRANCPRWPGFAGGGSFGAVNGPFSGGPASSDFDLNPTGKLPGQRRNYP